MANTKVTIYRSAKTGRLVTKQYAAKHPSTTVKETTKKQKYNRKGE